MAPFKVNDKVKGVSKALSGHQGVVADIVGESYQRKYEILWEDGHSSLEAAKALSFCDEKRRRVRKKRAKDHSTDGNADNDTESLLDNEEDEESPVSAKKKKKK